MHWTEQEFYSQRMDFINELVQYRVEANKKIEMENKKHYGR